MRVATIRDNVVSIPLESGHFVMDDEEIQLPLEYVSIPLESGHFVI